MRICMVTTFYPPYHFGGDATYIRALSSGLVARGHEVEVIHCEDAYRLVNKGCAQGDPVEDDGVIVHRLKSPFGFLSPLITQQTGKPGLKSKAIRKILDREFDVVNFHNISLIGGPAVLKLSKAPVTLYTLHEHWLICSTHVFWKNRTRVCDRRQCFSCSIRSGIPPQLWRCSKLIENSMEAVDALIAPSHYIAKKHSEAGFKVPIHVMNLFSAVNPDTPAEYNPPSRPLFLFAGRLTASKGIAPLLKLFASRKDYDLQLAGDGDLREKLQRQFSNCGNIRFLGALSQENLIKHYQNATALIFPSLAPEVFSLVIAEALACGAPAIVNASGGAAELIETTGGGFIYKSESELTSAMGQLADNASLRRELGKKARAGFEKFYTLQIHLDSYLDLISDIQKRNRDANH